MSRARLAIAAHDGLAHRAVAALALAALALGSFASADRASAAVRGGPAADRPSDAAIRFGPAAHASGLARPWPGPTITYFNEARRWRHTVDRAAGMWNWARVGIRLRRVSRPSRAQVHVFEVRDGTLGRNTAGRAVEGYAPGYPSWIKIQHGLDPEWALKTALHEWGHVLGLNHRGRVCAVMKPGAGGPCAAEHPRPWLERCRLLQRDDVRRASWLYGGPGRLRPLYCRVQPGFEGSYRLIGASEGLRIVAGRWATGLTVLVGSQCGQGRAQRYRPELELGLPVGRGCVRLWTRYPRGNRSQPVDVRFHRYPPVSPAVPQQPAEVGTGGGPPPRPLDEGFESPLAGRWAANPVSGWARTSEAAHGGTYSVADSPGGPYFDNTDSTLELSRPLDLQGRSACYLVWYARYDLELGFDYFVMEMRRDTASPWLEVGERISGSREFFGVFFDDLTPFEGSPYARLRLRFVSDSSITGGGVEVDDVYVHCDA